MTKRGGHDSIGWVELQGVLCFLAFIGVCVLVGFALGGS